MMLIIIFDLDSEVRFPSLAWHHGKQGIEIEIVNSHEHEHPLLHATAVLTAA